MGRARAAQNCSRGAGNKSRWEPLYWSFVYISAATPVISSSTGAYEYEVISGTTITLTCTSSSDPASSGIYEWSKDSGVL